MAAAYSPRARRISALLSAGPCCRVSGFRDSAADAAAGEGGDCGMLAASRGPAANGISVAVKSDLHGVRSIRRLLKMREPFSPCFGLRAITSFLGSDQTRLRLGFR